MYLKDQFPKHNLYTPAEAAKQLGWEFEENSNGIENIKCCEENVTVVGFLGEVSYAYCTKCGKQMQNVLGIFMISNSTAGMIDIEDIDENDINAKRGSVWIISTKGK